MFDTREQWLNAYIDASRPAFEAYGKPLPQNIRVSISSPSVNARKRKAQILGECWATHASSDGFVEIFIIASVVTAVRIADILTHELCHAALNNDHGHGKPFKELATAMGLQGKMTATVAGPEWFDWVTPILEELGPIPYAPMIATTGDKGSPKKKRPTYGLKLECPECGWLARSTATHVTPFEFLNCPVPDCDGTLTNLGA